MSRPVIPDVTLASADPAILQCWEEKVRQGAKCSLLLKHSNGKIETILKSTSMSAKPKVQSYAPPASSPVERKKRSKGSKKTRLDALLAYHQRLVVEKGMPPSRLMLKHAAEAPLHPVLAEQTPTDIKCDFCDFKTSSQNGLKIHKGLKHKEHHKHEVPCHNEDIACGKKTPKATFKCPACLKLFVSEHNLWYHLYGYGGPEAQPNCVGMATVRCHICKHPESSCLQMENHVRKEHNRTAHILSRENGKNHSVVIGDDEVLCNSWCTGENNIVTLQTR